MKVDSSVTINQPVNTVFDWLVGYYPQNLQKWSPGFQEIQPTSPGPIGVGSTFRQVRTIQGKPMEMNAQVVELQPPHRFVLLSRGQDQQVTASYTFQPTGPNSTQLTLEIDMEGGFPRMVAPIVSRQVKKETEEDLNRVKEQLRG